MTRSNDPKPKYQVKGVKYYSDKELKVNLNIFTINSGIVTDEAGNNTFGEDLDMSTDSDVATLELGAGENKKDGERSQEWNYPPQQ